MENHDETSALVAEILHRGDRNSFAHLVKIHLPRVFAICLGYLGEMADAEDAAQDVFLKGYQKIGTLEDAGRFKAWIDQIARHRCLDILRRQNRRREKPLTDIHENLNSPARDQDLELQEALARLDEKHRLPLVLYYFHGKDTEALADQLGLTQGGACTRLFRARVQLRRILEEEVPHE